MYNILRRLFVFWVAVTMNFSTKTVALVKEVPLKNDDFTIIGSLKNTVSEFCDARNWDSHHTMKDLLYALSIEVAELMQIFRFKTPKEVLEILKSEKRQEVQDELGDILFLILRIHQKFNMDISTNLKEKLVKTRMKYPPIK